ncbi:MAG: carboxylesterase/lipase family protein [Polyangiales bacterium]
MTRTSSFLWLTLVLSLVLSACGGSSSGGSDPALLGDRVTTESGDVIGEIVEDLSIFRGIPYAAPPIGERRWRKPEPFGQFEGAFDAKQFGSACPQFELDAFVGSEDCLSLNIWAPRAGGSRPVMVFIHGGAYVTGSGSIELYEASQVAREGDVVVVTINYRLGPLGFLNSESLASESGDGSVGNYGIYDQIAALDWVRQNIEAFGGDPDNVTVFGESAGSISICALLGSPLADGLYHRAILESGGGCWGFREPRNPAPGYPSMVARGANLLGGLGCVDSEEGLGCARAASAEDVLRAAPAEPDGLTNNLMGGMVWGPGVDGHLLLEDPFERVARGAAPDVPLIIGTNLDEATVFTTAIDVNALNYREQIAASVGEERADAVVALYPIEDWVFAKAAFNVFATDLIIACSSEAFAEARSATGHPTRLYEFRHALRGLLGLVGATHTLELFFLFGNYFIYTPDAEELALGTALRTAWTSFAHDGVPELSPAWPTYERGTRSISVFDVPTGSADSWRDGRCEALRELGLTP